MKEPRSMRRETSRRDRASRTRGRCGADARVRRHRPRGCAIGRTLPRGLRWLRPRLGPGLQRCGAIRPARRYVVGLLGGRAFAAHPRIGFVIDEMADQRLAILPVTPGPENMGMPDRIDGNTRPSPRTRIGEEGNISPAMVFRSARRPAAFVPDLLDDIVNGQHRAAPPAMRQADDTAKEKTPPARGLCNSNHHGSIGRPDRSPLSPQPGRGLRDLGNTLQCHLNYRRKVRKRPRFC